MYRVITGEAECSAEPVCFAAELASPGPGFGLHTPKYDMYIYIYIICIYMCYECIHIYMYTYIYIHMHAHGCFYEHGLVLRALLFGVYVKAPDGWKLT